MLHKEDMNENDRVIQSDLQSSPRKTWKGWMKISDKFWNETTMNQSIDKFWKNLKQGQTKSSGKCSKELRKKSKMFKKLLEKLERQFKNE